MYQLLLVFHSFIRWVVIISLIITIYRSFRGWFTNKTFSVLDNQLRHWTATILHIQLAIGISLYYVSPLISFFFSQFKNAIHNREIRFFGMEHSTTMLFAIIIITLGSMIAKRKPDDTAKFKTIAISYSIALLIIFIIIPWPFSPMAERPYFRF